MEKSKKEKFTYNSVSLYKNNVPLNLDIDIIAEDLYKCYDNREMFNEIMNGIEKDVMSCDIEKKETEHNGKFSNSEVKRQNFKSSLPQGEFINPAPYQQKSNHKKYSDVNANSKYYYPPETGSLNDAGRSQWTNRTNRIMLDSQVNTSTNKNNSNFNMGSNTFFSTISNNPNGSYNF